MAGEWLRYANQGATRNQPLSQDLAQKLSFLRNLGITAEVFSGGQPGIGSGGGRVGSVRHDHGNSGDMFFYRDGRRLDWSNQNDLPLFQDIVRQGKAAGITGWGAGPGYMQPGSMHVGLGSPGVWGAGGRGANAPDWLRQAYGDTQQPRPVSGTATPMMAQGVTPPTPGTPLAAMYGTPQPAQAQAALSGLAAMYAEQESRRQEEKKAELEAEQVRRSALFSGPSPFR